MFWRFAVLSGGFLLLCAAPLLAQEPVLDRMYGSGVHAYFSQDYHQAYDHLTSAIDAGSADPRCHYFRGLCFLKLGREDEASMDFEQAARLEARDVSRFYNVGRALERIQGRTRLKVEKYRAEARMEAMKRAKELQRQRYGELREAEGRVLESQTQPAPAKAPPVVTDPLGLGPTQESPVGPDTAPAPEPATEAKAPAKAPAPTPPAKPVAKEAAPPPAKPEAKLPTLEPPAKPGPKANPFVEEPKP